MKANSKVNRLRRMLIAMVCTTCIGYGAVSAAIIEKSQHLETVPNDAVIHITMNGDGTILSQGTVTEVDGHDSTIEAVVCDKVAKDTGDKIAKDTGNKTAKDIGNKTAKDTGDIKATNSEKAMMVVKTKNGWGLVDERGRQLVAPTYKTVAQSVDGDIIFSQKGKDAIAVSLAPIRVSHDEPAVGEGVNPSDSYVVFKNDKKRYGFKREDGTVAIEPTLKEVYTGFSEGIAFVKNSHGDKVAIDGQGKELFAVDGDFFSPYHDGLAEIQRRTSGFNLLGAVAGIMIGNVFGGSDGHHIYIGVGRYSDDYFDGFVVSRDNIKRGYIDREGHWITKKQWEYVYPMMPFGTVVINDDRQLGTIDRKGNMLMPFGDYEMEEITFAKPYFVLKDMNTEKRGIKNYMDGSDVLPFLYEKINLWDTDRFVATTATDKRVYALEPSRHEVFTLSKKAEFGPYINGVAWVYKDTALGGDEHAYKLIDENGKVLLSLNDKMIDDVGSFHGDYAAIKKNGKWGAIRRDGTWAVEPVYDDLYMLQSENKLTVSRR